MGRNHNLYGGVRIGAPMTFNDTLLDVADSDNGLPIRDVATRFRRSSAFTPSIAWRYEDAGPTDVTSPTKTSLSGTIGTVPYSSFMSPDGSTLFVLDDNVSTTRVFKIPTSTPYNVNGLVTADGSSMGFFVGKNSTSIPNCRGLWFSRDGQYMFISDLASPSIYGTVDDGGATGQTGDSVHRYTAITPWVSYNTTADQMIGVRSANTSILFDPTGKYFFSAENGFIDRYDLGTAYDFTTLTNNSVSLNWNTFFGSQSAYSVAFSQDGYRMVVKTDNSDTNRIRYYPLSTPFDPSTIGTELHSWTTGVGGTNNSTIMMTEDGAHLYNTEITNDRIGHWSIPSEGGTMGQV